MANRLVVLGSLAPPPPSTQYPIWGLPLKWALCDLNGVPIAQFWDRQNSEVNRTFNDACTSQLDISMYDEASQYVKSMASVLKVWYGDAIVFAGRINNPNFGFDTGRAQIQATDPSLLMRKRYFQATFSRPNTQQLGQTMRDIVTDANLIDDTGLLLGTTETTDNPGDPTTFNEGDQHWNSLTTLAGLLGAPDFGIEAVDQQDGKLAKFNIAEKYGLDKRQDVIFTYGTLDHNCIAFNFNPSGENTVNWYKVKRSGDTPAEALTQHLASQAVYGILQGFEGNTNILDVQLRADQMVAAYHDPTPYFQFTPAIQGLDAGYGAPPQAIRDYDVGDEVTVVAKKGSVTLSIDGRITNMRLFEADSAGNVRCEVTAIPSFIATGIS